MDLKPGDTAPDFTLPDQEGNDVKLSELRGKNVVLYFYPKADTPGCTTQACGVRDHRPDYESANAVVLGVSPDTVKKVAKFDQKYGLGFPLLADEDHSVAESYGVWVAEVDVRAHLHGQRALDLRDRPRRQDRAGLSQGQARRARPARARRAAGRAEQAAAKPPGGWSIRTRLPDGSRTAKSRVPQN